MMLSHKIRLNPTKSQIEAMARACGCARFAWNWGLAEWKKQHASGLKPTGFGLQKAFNAIKETQFPWIYGSPKDANQRPFANLQKAFGNFFAKRSKYPKFKSKGVHDSFYLSNTVFSLDGKTAKIPKVGIVKTRQELRFHGKIMSGTVSRHADRWYLSVLVELAAPPKTMPATSNIIRLDLGLTTTVTDSKGVKHVSPKPLKKFSKKLARLQKSHSRKVRGSQNRSKSRNKIACLHLKITDIRNDWTHKFTSKIIHENQVVGLEDLNVSGMLRNHKLAKAISDVSWFEIRRQLEYKARLYGREVRTVDRFFPSSKTCSKCGVVKTKLLLSERVFKCDECNHTADRDVNAAINIANTVGYTGIQACGAINVR
jgi:putative transposase